MQGLGAASCSNCKLLLAIMAIGHYAKHKHCNACRSMHGFKWPWAQLIAASNSYAVTASISVPIGPLIAAGGTYSKNKCYGP